MKQMLFNTLRWRTFCFFMIYYTLSACFFRDGLLQSSQTVQHAGATRQPASQAGHTTADSTALLNPLANKIADSTTLSTTSEGARRKDAHAEQ